MVFKKNLIVGDTYLLVPEFISEKYVPGNVILDTSKRLIYVDTGEKVPGFQPSDLYDINKKMTSRVKLSILKRVFGK